MNTPLADDYTSIKARMEEIAKERALAPAEHAMQNAVENYSGDESKATEFNGGKSMDWDIYAPVNLNSA